MAWIKIRDLKQVARHQVPNSSIHLAKREKLPKQSWHMDE